MLLMSKGTGIKGTTVPKLSRRNLAEGRQAVRADRSPEEQLRELDLRPGNSTRERARLQKEIDQ
jgi:hypothetical protein